MRTTANGYLIQLDGLRFVAVGLVLGDHLMADVNTIPFGPLGVTLFFVLSGFLITRILITSRDKTLGQPGGLGTYLRKFFIRRTLRIFPIYYITVFVLYLLDEPPVRDTIAWIVLYATNIYIAVNQSWMGTIDHFWSLAVEEQFYIFFPFVIFFIPRRWLIPLFITMVVSSVVLRAIFYRAGFDWMVNYVSTPTCLDSFGLGGLMAWMQLQRKDFFVKLFRNPLWVWLGLASWVLVVYWSKTFVEVHNVANDVWERLFGSLFCFFLIGKAVVGFEGGMRWFLENPVSNYLGKISYGLYLYHNFVYNHYHTQAGHPTLRLLHKIHQYIPALKGVVVFEVAYFFLLTVLVASLSWHLIEKPINQLKDRYAR
ncbi:acyltransferase [Rhabdobacter roseus]|uniref:Peptidoglycan/LPS O-acetylase OafA/YrhL n=1 Tax=Rhabdobacter roseus TaxID=1655419 RepID=A0A840TIT8_9BACT|nr:acyltransferase [Rhabdobacter roseus]MBB5283364.1 peptidoglycan/LPS O-acetylase OafA/YrhL [Rhabdobacter roseus]